MLGIHGRILRCTKYALWTREIKMIFQRKPEEIAHRSNSDSASDSLSPWVHPCTFFVLHFFSPSWLILSLLHYCLYLWGFFFVQSWRARALSVTTGFVRIWCFPLLQPGLNLWSRIQVPLQTVSGWGYLKSVFKVVLGHFQNLLSFPGYYPYTQEVCMLLNFCFLFSC